MDTESEKNSNDPNQSSTETPLSLLLFGQLQAGDSKAAAELFDRYIVRLIALARSRLNQGMRRRIDPEDVVHSAYRSFFVRAAEGDFELQESGDLWRLLAQITLNKVRKQAERQTAARRDVSREERLDVAAPTVAPQPTPEEAVILVEQVRLVVERLSGDERRTLTAFLAGDSVDEIARRLAKSPRTIRRVLSRVRGLIEHELLGTDSASARPSGEVPPLAEPLPYSDYRLERLIGAGGMGKVYRATQWSTGESVAVKALRKDRQFDVRAVRQFIHEAEVVAGVSHPGIIRVRGLGRFPAGGYFLVMEWIEGTDLQARLDKREVTPSQGIRIIEAVAEAVQHAHQAGVVHCDLKPANILIGADDRVVVTDFGFAQLISGNEKRMAVGGTLGYLAPELLEAGSAATAAADIYSLGKLMQRVIESDALAFAKLRERALRPDPSKRLASASHFLEEYRRAMTGVK